MFAGRDCEAALRFAARRELGDGNLGAGPSISGLRAGPRRYACEGAAGNKISNFNLVLLAEPRRWFDAVAPLLLWELNQQQFDTLHSPG